ncbi:MAG: DUF2933 domain-containing protein [Candidatus Woesearchaeota archaeon]|nr:DUF2933 domain-containing protein [Candidatus Woesearchaeota archaeon]
MNMKNHNLLMILCCAIPLLLLLAINILGINNKYLFWFALLLCPVMHFVMMQMHHKPSSETPKEQKEGGGCH